MSDGLPGFTEGGKLKLKDEFIVCFARGYPDPFECYPNTLEYARDFQRRHGGVIKYRVVSEWEPVE